MGRKHKRKHVDAATSDDKQQDIPSSPDTPPQPSPPSQECPPALDVQLITPTQTPTPSSSSTVTEAQESEEECVVLQTTPSTEDTTPLEKAKTEDKPGWFARFKRWFVSS